MPFRNLKSLACNVNSFDLFYICRWGPWSVLPDDFGNETVQENAEEPVLKFLPLYETSLSPEQSGYWHQICGLLLREVPERSTLYDGTVMLPVYQRVGCARVSKSEYAAETAEHDHQRELLNGPWDEESCETIVLV
jgi:hypothetical protein